MVQTIDFYTNEYATIDVYTENYIYGQKGNENIVGVGGHPLPSLPNTKAKSCIQLHGIEHQAQSVAAVEVVQWSLLKVILTNDML